MVIVGITREGIRHTRAYRTGLPKAARKGSRRAKPRKPPKLLSASSTAAAAP